MNAEQQIASICQRKGLKFTLGQLDDLVILCTEFAAIEVENHISYNALKQCDDFRGETLRCPDCETPNQFGELCNGCREAQHEARGEEQAP